MTPLEHMQDHVAAVRAIVAHAPADPSTAQCMLAVAAHAEALVEAVESYILADTMAAQRIARLEADRDRLRAQVMRLLGLTSDPSAPEIV